ncbi:hypothetical protein B0H14DRAFT_3497825 [Mycena olivaceomarginata]|nr:hypothetical protein B0H14DRAFT_3497825 [Mycena olivaceomarginata]
MVPMHQGTHLIFGKAPSSSAPCLQDASGLPRRHLLLAASPPLRLLALIITSSLGPLTPPPLPTISSLSPIPLLQYDVSLHPSTISNHRRGLSAAAFLEPAVYPPRLSLSLVTPHLPWTIPVPASNRRYVSVGDILPQSTARCA